MRVQLTKSQIVVVAAALRRDALRMKEKGRHEEAAEVSLCANVFETALKVAEERSRDDAHAR